MDTVEAFVLAKMLMHKHGLDGWNFNWDRRKKAFGYCRPSTKTISLSVHLVECNDKERVTDTILHEIAHALDWIRNRKCGHDWTWKVICIEVGCKPQQYYTDEDTTSPDPKYVLKNVVTGKIVAKYYRLPTKIRDRQQHLFESGKPETKGQLKLYKCI